MSDELKRYFCLIDHITDAGKVHLTLTDSQDISVRYTAVTTVQKLKDQSLRVHEGKNFHLVINRNGEWSLFWIKNSFLDQEEEQLRHKAFNELLDLYYKQK